MKFRCPECGHEENYKPYYIPYGTTVTLECLVCEYEEKIVITGYVNDYVN